MEILVAKSAGFCFGVQKAIDKAEGVSNTGINVFAFGPIIHNTQVVNDLKLKGVEVLNDIKEVREGDRVIIRSHGVPKDEYDKLVEAKAEIIDATCPYVQHIHKIVEDKSNAGYKIVIVGDPDHPEVKGVNGWCGNNALIINSLEDINEEVKRNNKICIVAQTTYNLSKWNSILCELIKNPKEILIYNTICNATETRQLEALELSKQVDAMIVVGGKDSSNTRKLYEICMGNCEKTIFIETAEELDLKSLENLSRVGITAGASTPEYAIKAVIERLTGCIKNDTLVSEKEEPIKQVPEKVKDFENDPYAMSFKTIYPGMIIQGTVILVSDKEAFVDVGFKSDGVLPANEVLSSEGSLKNIFKAGDVIEVEVIQMNDGEGNVLLSRKAVEKQEFYEKLHVIKDEGRIIEVLITGANKGGFECKYDDVRGFMPISLSGVAMGEDTTALVGKRVRVKIAEIKDRKREVEIIVSRKEILREEKHERVKNFFGSLEEGLVIKGIIKSIINVGVFVTVNELDIFVPISELSWRRIDKPSEVVQEGQTVEIVLTKVDRENLKATGSIKKAGKEPFEKFVEGFSEEDIIEGKVARFTDFGAFVELIEGVDGLIHISNISDRRINKPQDALKIGQMVKAKIIKIDKENKRVALTLKDIE